MPGIGGIGTLRRLKELRPHLPVVMWTGDGDIASAVEAMKLGAFDFWTRPVHSAPAGSARICIIGWPSL